MNKVINQTKLQFPSHRENEQTALSMMKTFLENLNIIKEEADDICTSTSEAVTNAIIHAYPDKIGNIILQVRAYKDGRVIVKIQDKGVGIPDVREAMTPLFTTGGEDRSGLGFSVMDCFSDKVSVFSKPGIGTTVTIEKRTHRNKKSEGKREVA